MPPSLPATAQQADAQRTAQAVLACVPELMREIRAAMRRAAPPGLTVPQFRALIFAQRFPGAGVGELAAHLGVTPPTASVAVARLARQGLLRIGDSGADRRRRPLWLSPAGQAVVEAAWAQTSTEFAERLIHLHPVMRGHLRDALHAACDLCAGPQESPTGKP